MPSLRAGRSPRSIGPTSPLCYTSTGAEPASRRSISATFARSGALRPGHQAVAILCSSSRPATISVAAAGHVMNPCFDGGKIGPPTMFQRRASSGLVSGACGLHREVRPTC